ncbi:unnamed protein product, partial [Rotaria sp. Silwood2]
GSTYLLNARWVQDAMTVAGGHGAGNDTNQLNNTRGICVDDDQNIIIADSNNDRIIQYKMGDTNGKVVAGDHGEGSRLNQLNKPKDVLIDKETVSLVICNRGNRRVVRWSRRNGVTQGEILLDNIGCLGLAMDDQRFLYVADFDKDEVRRYRIGDKNGVLVAGGHGRGTDLNQLDNPSHIFVDR